jgi:predicted PhzF superfamily epimerase YddE/YHI9
MLIGILEVNTAFVRRSERADFQARYFTPAVEIPLAGHPMIATVFMLIDSGRLRLRKSFTRNTIDTFSFIAEQGHWLYRPGMGRSRWPAGRYLGCQSSGQAVTVLCGELLLPDNLE